MAERGRLDLTGIEKAYGSARALSGIDFAVAPGEFVALLGPSGCGKTTLLRCIAGLIPIDAGEIRVDGRSLQGTAAWTRDISVVFQSYALFPHMTVAENVRFGLRMRRVDRAAAARRVRDALVLVRMESFADRLPNQLSGGQQQRVALARAIVVEPTILLLDEPLAALDARLRASVQLEIRQLQSRLGITTILVTHDQSEAMIMADRIAVMNGGRIEQVATPRELYARPRTPFVAEFVGEINSIPGTVEPGARFRLAADNRMLRLPADETPTGPAILMIRPEALRIGPVGGTGLAGVVTDVLLIGDRFSIFADLGGLTLRATISNRIEDRAAVPVVGQAVNLDWDPRDALLFAEAPDT